MEQFKEIELTALRSNPWNLKTRCHGPDFDALIASVRKKGVIQPILVRPLADDSKQLTKSGDMITHEIVAGERRFRSALCVAEENGGPKGRTISAVIRILTDDEAFELTMIENLHRKDLTELEEAHGFKTYLDRKGMEALPELVERTGIDHRYIRRRVALLGLPKSALKAWDKGELKYGHLEQLCRLKDKKEILEYTKRIIEMRFGGYSVRRLKIEIDDKAPELKNAKFDIEKAGCISCSQNSDVQKEMFGDMGAMDKTRCLSPKCFKQNQNNWLTAHWKKSGYRKKHGTNGFRFSDDLGYNDYHNFYSSTARKECKECPKFITIINLDGSVDEGRVCIGDRKCFDKKPEPTTAKNKTKVEDGSPRVAWHGEHFREMFYEKQIPLRFKEVPAEDVKAMRLALVSLLEVNRDLHFWFAKRHDIRNAGKKKAMDFWRLKPEEIAKTVFGMDLSIVQTELKAAALETIMQNGFGARERWLVAEHIGIDLKKEWQLNKEYLEKKTIKEMLQMGEVFGIFKDQKALAFLYETLGKKRKAFKGCKKQELIRVFLESGVDLAGKVPAEILG